MEDANQIIQESGNSFHCKVINKLRSDDWTVLVSPYFMDGITEKPREIDLIAEKMFIVKNEFREETHQLHVKLFIECKYITQSTVFWFDKKDRNSAKNRVISDFYLKDGNLFTGKHHYLSESDSVAKLFASKAGKNLENDVIYKALNQVLNGFINKRNNETIIQSEKDNPLRKKYIGYPIITFNSFNKFYKTEISKTDTTTNIDKNFQLEVDYAFKTPSGSIASEYFIIDMVDFNKFDSFMETISNDIAAIKRISK